MIETGSVISLGSSERSGVFGVSLFGVGGLFWGAFFLVVWFGVFIICGGFFVCFAGVLL